MKPDLFTCFTESEEFDKNNCRNATGMSIANFLVGQLNETIKARNLNSEEQKSWGIDAVEEGDDREVPQRPASQGATAEDSSEDHIGNSSHSSAAGSKIPTVVASNGEAPARNKPMQSVMQRFNALLREQSKKFDQTGDGDIERASAATITSNPNMEQHVTRAEHLGPLIARSTPQEIARLASTAVSVSNNDGVLSATAAGPEVLFTKEAYASIHDPLDLRFFSQKKHMLDPAVSPFTEGGAGEPYRQGAAMAKPGMKPERRHPAL
ncbi:hypothetical protein QFC21_006382 [Naganishia friedmannii]|uniref:Uncharacterized protein n=1 Tax=Naganishia friedmannii TaxID=89922 RepID=A0ACC2V3Z1_9TREE|nr:hypothetical protein QFC21_006382 [Naganishia friedmannii]